jgi:hypothetical protein
MLLQLAQKEKMPLLCTHNHRIGHVAQLDRASDYESEG